jgi:dUTP pyrophosphatase
LRIKPPYGYYCEIYGRSSISKSGFCVANSVGIIDPGYTGNLMVALTKTDPLATLSLPFKCCQIVFRKHILPEMEEVSSFDCGETVRQGGGFGSTGT